MKPHVASSIHAFSLIVISIIGYTVTKSNTALIPLIFGAVLLPLNNSIRYQNKTVSHIAVLLTLLVTVALVKPFTAALGDSDTMGMLRVGIMMLTGIVAMVAFIQSFIQARKNKA